MRAIRLAKTGRSPRVRGRLALRRALALRQGSIPACAGEATVSSFVNGPKEVDPRVCGGGIAADMRFMSKAGRSPRVRGRPARP